MITSQFAEAKTCINKEEPNQEQNQAVCAFDLVH